MTPAQIGWVIAHQLPVTLAMAAAGSLMMWRACAARVLCLVGSHLLFLALTRAAICVAISFIWHWNQTGRLPAALPLGLVNDPRLVPALTSARGWLDSARGWLDAWAVLIVAIAVIAGRHKPRVVA